MRQKAAIERICLFDELERQPDHAFKDGQRDDLHSIEAEPEAEMILEQAMTAAPTDAAQHHPPCSHRQECTNAHAFANPCLHRTAEHHISSLCLADNKLCVVVWAHCRCAEDEFTGSEIARLAKLEAWRLLDE